MGNVIVTDLDVHCSFLLGKVVFLNDGVDGIENDDY